MNLSIPLYALLSAFFLHEKPLTGGFLEQQKEQKEQKEQKKWNCSITFFDSYGNEPPLEMKNTIIKGIQSQIQNSLYFDSITKRYFDTRVQKDKRTTGQCGIFAIHFIENMIFGDFNLNDYTDQNMVKLRNYYFNTKTSVLRCKPDAVSLEDLMQTRKIRLRDDTIIDSNDKNSGCEEKSEYPYTKMSEWLSNKDIDEILLPYEQIPELKFKHFNTVGIDAADPEKCYSQELCDLDIDHLFEQGIRNFGIVYNTDPTHSYGQHWIALFVKFEEKK
tara:strand:- start:582 stop:1406 length:825 start_codon:yes stop_codon:yes gene_type:complete